MKSLGKITALALAVGMAFVLTACGGAASSSAASSSASASSASAASASAASASSEAADSSAAAALSEASESASAEAVESSAAAASSEAAASSKKYENEFFGLAYFLPEGWTFADKDNVSTINSQLVNAASGSTIDMAAKSADETSIVLVTVEQPSDSNAGQTVESRLEDAVKQITGSTTGASVSTVTEDSEITFPGSDSVLPCKLTTITVDGNELHIAQTVMEKEGAFLDVTVIAPTQEAVSTAMGGFKLILG